MSFEIKNTGSNPLLIEHIEQRDGPRVKVASSTMLAPGESYSGAVGSEVVITEPVVKPQDMPEAAPTPIVDATIAVSPVEEPPAEAPPE